jgi:beta-fructofuranosidase
MNDPNGVIQWKGRYHIFYQYNPLGAYHSNIHWGHAVSDDLIHWERLPVAIAPDPGTVDEGGIFSGSMVDNNGTPTAFYTGVNHGATIQQQCMATSDDDLISWVKHPGNPIVTGPPDAAQQTVDFRDPYVWREGSDWYMAVGSCVKGVGGTVFLYTSPDLQHWRYLNPLIVGDALRQGVIWECPNFFQLGDKWVLIISSHTGQEINQVMYLVGEYRDHRFYPEYEALFDRGPYYAPLSHVDEQGRRLIWGWIPETRSQKEQLDAGWSGAQAIPRVLTLDDKNRLHMEPVPELKQLRTVPKTGCDLDHMPFQVPSLELDIELSFDIQDEQRCGLRLEWNDTTEHLVIFYDPVMQTLNIHNNLHKTPRNDSVVGRQHRLDAGETLDLRILVDHSVIEIIANNRSSITHRMYLSTSELPHLELDHSDAVRSFSLWEMKNIWE